MELKNYEIKKELVIEWLLLVYDLSGSNDLENAITLGKMVLTSDKDREIVNTVSVLYRLECSGDINPPIKMIEVYDEICKKNRNK